MRKFIITLLCLCIICLPCAAGIKADASNTLTISSADDFAEFAESCRLDAYSKNLSVSLECDLDLSGEDFQGIPIFFGSFDGKGHSISGLCVTVESSAVGFFRYLMEGAGCFYFFSRPTEL